MEYYLISPKVDGVNVEEFVDEMFKKHIVMMGWHTDNAKGQQFNNMSKGDFVLVARRQNWEFIYYFAGVIDDEESSYDEDDHQYRKIKNFIDLRNYKTDILSEASFVGQRVIPAIIKINEYNNESVIGKLNKIRNMGAQKEYIDSVIKLLKSNYNLILTGAPGTGKTYLAKKIAEQMVLGHPLEDEERASAEEKAKMDEQYDFVQFHPSLDYTDFIEGLRPIDAGNGNVSFRREDGMFMAFCRKALTAYNNAKAKNEETPKYIFVIDEINRGEISKIYGELFFSIDPGYRGEKGKVRTQYSNLWKTSDDEEHRTFGGSNSFYVPENVYIIGTMNDIDRSVETMDFAMRRRFAFKEVSADERKDMIKEDEKIAAYFDDIDKHMTNLNNCILSIPGLSKSYQIGAAYYLKLKNYLPDNTTVDNAIPNDSWKDLWDNHIYGLLFEYLRGIPEAQEYLNRLKDAFDLKVLYDENGNEIKK